MHHDYYINNNHNQGVSLHYIDATSATDISYSSCKHDPVSTSAEGL